MTGTPSGMFCTHRNGQNYCADRWFCNCACHVYGTDPKPKRGIIRRVIDWVIDAETERLNRETIIADAIARADNPEPTDEEHRAFLRAVQAAKAMHRIHGVPTDTPADDLAEYEPELADLKKLVDLL